MTIFSELGPDAGIGDILLSHPERFAPILTFAHTIMRTGDGLDSGTRELLAAFVSGLNDCAFCHGVHAATAERFGVDPDLLQALLGEGTDANLAAPLKPIFELARKLTQTPAQVTEADRQAVLDAGHTQEVLKDVIALVALFAFFNRLVDGHGVTGNSALFARDAEMLFVFGYTPPPQ